MKSALEPSGPSDRWLSPVLVGYGVKQLGVFLLPPGWDASPLLAGLPLTLNSAVPIHTPGWREAVLVVSCPNKTTHRLEPGPLIRRPPLIKIFL